MAQKDVNNYVRFNHDLASHNSLIDEALPRLSVIRTTSYSGPGVTVLLHLGATIYTVF